MKVAYQDLSRWNKQELADIEAVISRVLRRGRFILGEELSAFEKEFAAYTGKEYAVGVGSGTDAITLALIASGIIPGDEVITSSLTAYPTITGIERAGGVPVVIDCEGDTGLIDPAKIVAAVTERTKAIVPVHLWGNACEMDKIQVIARQNGLVLIEDCAQAVGAEYFGEKAGYWSDCAAYSFYPSKNLGALGDGGAIATNSIEMFQKVKQLRNYGQKEREINAIPGINSRLDEIQAAVLRIKLQYLSEKLEKRKIVAERYTRGLPNEILISLTQNSKSGYHVFPVIINERNGLKEYLGSKGVDVLVHYPEAVYAQPGFQGRKYGTCENAEYIAARELSLPINEFMQEEEQEFVISLLKGWLKP
ncbi:MAG: DegT/DnrJ/EryC1/StrS family aminotransferase [Candidatus Cloacimonetes bacterium]|nr:DegT/DnrJ/EryC1/StrS family aminotransferase [Candidatus Cloacimonadota bacterium]